MLSQVFAETEVLAQKRQPDKQASAYGGTLIWGVCHKPTIINPILTTVSVSASLEDLIFNRLVRLNSQGEIEADLAESWEISSDGLVYTFYLRKGVKFHDGKECTADDVKFTYDKIIDQKVNSPFRGLFQLVKEFRVVDEYIFQIILDKPCVSFAYKLVREIIPKHLLENADIKDCSFNSHPIGSGPFRFQEWGKDNQIILEYNPDYYEGRPYLDKIIVKTYPDSEALWTALMRGEVDLVMFIERKDYEVLKDDPSFKTFAFPADYYYALVYNLNDSILADKEIREAIACAIDRRSLIERVAFGYGLECSGPFYPQSLGFNPGVRPIGYNPEKAIELLKEAGWSDEDNDGILEKNTEELEIRALVDSRNDLFKRIVMLIRQQLQEVGIKIKVILYDDEGMLADEEFIKKHNPQARLKFLFSGLDPNLAREEWYSKERKRSYKLWTYTNREVNTLFETGEINLDKEKRQKIYQRIHRLIYADQPAGFLYFPFVFHAVSSRFENTDELFNLNMPFYTVKDWQKIEGR
jgi:peptide/nickel transport system substrate-binding protein